MTATAVRRRHIDICIGNPIRDIVLVRMPLITRSSPRFTRLHLLQLGVISHRRWLLAISFIFLLVDITQLVFVSVSVSVFVSTGVQRHCNLTPRMRQQNRFGRLIIACVQMMRMSQILQIRTAPSMDDQRVVQRRVFQLAV